MLSQADYNSEYFATLSQAALSSARIVVPALLSIIQPQSVIDVGCGIGAWLSVFREHGIETILGLDGEYVDRSQLLVPRSCFRVADLAEPVTLHERFDLAVSLEVAEHLPPSSANGFVESLCRLAPVVLFSAAFPGQGGTCHLNEQWPDYWRRLFNEKGFLMFDPLRPVLWHDKRVAFYYRQNMYLFVCADLVQSSPRLIQLPEVKDGNELLLVAGYIVEGNTGLRVTLRRLPRLLRDSIVRCFKKILEKRKPSDSGRQNIDHKSVQEKMR